MPSRSSAVPYSVPGWLVVAMKSTVIDHQKEKRMPMHLLHIQCLMVRYDELGSFGKGFCDLQAPAQAVTIVFTLLFIFTFFDTLFAALHTNCLYFSLINNTLRRLNAALCYFYFVPYLVTLPQRSHMLCFYRHAVLSYGYT